MLKFVFPALSPKITMADMFRPAVRLLIPVPGNPCGPAVMLAVKLKVWFINPVGPCMPCSRTKLNIAAAAVPTFVTDDGKPVTTVPTAIVAAAPSAPFALGGPAVVLAVILAVWFIMPPPGPMGPGTPGVPFTPCGPNRPRSAVHPANTRANSMQRAKIMIWDLFKITRPGVFRFRSE